MSERVQCSTEFCCGQWHDWPHITPCPKCGQIKPVRVWEAWGHPNGELYCEHCVGLNAVRRDPDTRYWTWHLAEGQPVVYEWGGPDWLYRLHLKRPCQECNREWRQQRKYTATSASTTTWISR